MSICLKISVEFTAIVGGNSYEKRFFMNAFKCYGSICDMYFLFVRWLPMAEIQQKQFRGAVWSAMGKREMTERGRHRSAAVFSAPLCSTTYTSSNEAPCLSSTCTPTSMYFFANLFNYGAHWMVTSHHKTQISDDTAELQRRSLVNEIWCNRARKQRYRLDFPSVSKISSANVSASASSPPPPPFNAVTMCDQSSVGSEWWWEEA